MDAHLFRLFAARVEPLLQGSRIEKIQEPISGVLSITFYGNGLRRQLFFRFSRKEPFCFLSNERLAANAQPSAAIMRIRRYFGNRRVASVVTRFCAREFWLMASSLEEGSQQKTVWLCLNLAKGASLHFLDIDKAPEQDEPDWPEPENLAGALEDWRSWPVLTPALRKTMSQLDPPEQWALLQDLRAGDGDVFLYCPEAEAAGNIAAVSAWPLPRNLCGSLRETASHDVVAALELAGKSLVLRKLYDAWTDKLTAPLQKKEARLKKLLAKLDIDEKKLRGMVGRFEDALLLRDNLWLWPPDLHADSVTVEQNGDEKTISLQKRFSVRENMERLFHDARRGKRGLEHVRQRRESLAGELEALSHPGPMQNASQAVATEVSDKGEKPVLAALAQALPKNVSAFLSSDGYVLLRGKDAKGNLALRKLAAGHDLWTHVRDGAGAHVVIRRKHPGEEVPVATMDEAAALCAVKSWQAGAASAWIMYAEMRHVKPSRNGPKGHVKIDKLWTTRLAPVDPEIEKKLASTNYGQAGVGAK